MQKKRTEQKLRSRKSYVYLITRCKVPYEKSLESLDVARGVASHLVNGVADSIEVLLLCHLCKLELTCACAVTLFVVVK